MNRILASPLICFFVLAYGWTWLCWGAVVVGKGPATWLATCGQFGPFIAAALTTWIGGGRGSVKVFFSRLVRWRGHPGWLAVCLLLLPVTMLVAIFLFASFHGALASLQFREEWATLPLHFVYLLILCGPLGEEPGWTGFALARLQARSGPIWASLWLGMFRAGWHLPLWWMYPPPCSFPLFVVGAVLLQFLTTWLFNHTGGSVVPALLFHTSLSLASVRLPDVPAYHLWVVCLLPLVLLLYRFDKRLRPALRASASN
jgi:membrane protease YdiL (CAAX protease family)